MCNEDTHSIPRLSVPILLIRTDTDARSNMWLYAVFVFWAVCIVDGAERESNAQPLDAIFENVTAMIVDATKVHRATSFHYSLSYAEHAAVEDAIEYSQVIQHLYIPLNNAFSGSNFSNRFQIRCPGWACNSTETPCIPLEHQHGRSPHHLESSNEALWWKMFKSQFEEQTRSLRSNTTYDVINVLIHPQSNKIISSDCHLAFVSGRTADPAAEI